MGKDQQKLSCTSLLIGMLTQKTEEILQEACAYVAQGKGVSFFRFSPKDVKADSSFVRGYELCNGEWVSKYFPRPDVYIDRLKERENSAFTHVYQWLQDVPSTHER